MTKSTYQVITCCSPNTTNHHIIMNACTLHRVLSSFEYNGNIMVNAEQVMELICQ